MMQAIALRDVIATVGLDDAAELATSFHQETSEVVEPWYRETLATDRHRLAEIDAGIAGVAISQTILHGNSTKRWRWRREGIQDASVRSWQWRWFSVCAPRWQRDRA
jgi:hypothetical protein